MQLKEVEKKKLFVLEKTLTENMNKKKVINLKAKNFK